MEIHPEVNYVTHLYTLAELGFSDSTYAAKYGGTLPQAAIDTLQKYKNYLTFGQGEGGMLAGPFFFGVSAEDIPNADSMRIVMDVVMNEGRKTNVPADVMAAVCAFGEADVKTFCRIFDRLSKEGIINPTELYHKGIMEYLNNNDGNK